MIYKKVRVVVVSLRKFKYNKWHIKYIYRLHTYLVVVVVCFSICIQKRERYSYAALEVFSFAAVYICFRLLLNTFLNVLFLCDSFDC